MLTYRGEITEGAFVPSDPDGYHRSIRTLEGKEVVVVVKQYRRIRSVKQNALYWLYLGALSEWSGHTTEELHQFFKLKFLPRRFITVLNEEVQDEPSTTVLDDKEFSEYLERIQAHTDVPIPDSNLLI